MSDLHLLGEPTNALDHLAAFGLAAILEDAGLTPTLAWTDELDTRLVLAGADWEEAGQKVLDHARRALQPTSWVMADGVNNGKPAGLFSPRVGVMEGTEAMVWFQDRNQVSKRLTEAQARLDLAMIGALGEPAYWAFDRDSPRPDNGASRWEMKTRNRGEEFVTHRLRGLAKAVAARSVGEVTAGLRGERAVDEVGKGKQDSRTPTGLTAPGPVDNARAWCALWGVSSFTVIHDTRGPSKTAGHAGPHGRGHLFLPVMTTPWPPARIRAVMRSAQLRFAASASTPAGRPATSVEVDEAWTWLGRHGVQAVARFEVFRSANASAPEKWAERGTLVFGA